MSSTDTAPKNAASAEGPIPAASFANQTWAALVLTLAGDPVTPNNLSNMLAWMTHENSPSTWTGTAGANNPLNNGLGSGGGDGTGSYPDLFTAAVYAAKGIQGGIFSSVCGGNHPGTIQAALKADAPGPVFIDAVRKSGWASGCYPSWTSIDSTPVVTAADSAKQPKTSGPVKVGNITPSMLGDPSALQQAEQGIATTGTTAENAAKDAVGWAGELGKLLGDVLSPSWWLRVGMGVLGVALFGIGLAGFISTTKPGEQAKSDAGGAIKGAAKDAAVAAVVA